MRRLAVGLALIVVACAPPAEKPTAAPVAPVASAPLPDPAMAANFKDCTWGEVPGDGVTIWAFACANDTLVWDAKIPGYAITRADPPTPMIRLFTKAADAPVDAILPALRAASPGPHTDACAITETTEGLQFLPTGAGKTAHDAFIAGKADGPSMPCGALGPSESGIRTIAPVPGAPDKVAVIDSGSDPQVFDATTLRGK